MGRLFLWVAVALCVAGGVAARADSSGQRAAAVEALIDLYDFEADEYDDLISDFNSAVTQKILAKIRAHDFALIGSRGPILVEFSDYQCGYCKQQYPQLLAEVEQGRARLLVVGIPVLGEASDLAARYSLAARKQGKFAEMHHRLMSAPRISQAGMDAAARALNLNMAQLQQDLYSYEVEAWINNNFYFARLLGIRSTPILFIGDTRINGLLQKEDLQALLDTRL